MHAVCVRMCVCVCVCVCVQRKCATVVANSHHIRTGVSHCLLERKEYMFLFYECYLDVHGSRCGAPPCASLGELRCQHAYSSAHLRNSRAPSCGCMPFQTGDENVLENVIVSRVRCCISCAPVVSVSALCISVVFSYSQEYGFSHAAGKRSRIV